MQPYFFPYAGYFRLIAEADIFVIYDCVQFPRRGWVHRNRLKRADGAPGWLTLPVQKCARDTAIADIRLSADASQRLDAQIQRFPALRQGLGRDMLREAPVTGAAMPLVDYLERGLAACCAQLDLSFKPVRSSTLGIAPSLTAESRIIAIVRALGGSAYINAPGGRALYDPTHFARHGLALQFLNDYQGPAWSILQRLATDGAEEIKRALAPNCLAA